MGVAAVLATCWYFSIAAAVADSGGQSVGGVTPSPNDAAQHRLASAIAIAVLAMALVLLVFLVASYALIRSVRRYRLAAERKRPAPTPSDDLWTQHKLPENWDEERDFNEDGQSPTG